MSAVARIATLLACVGAGACAVGPDYERPGIDTPETWRVPMEEAEEVANTAWWAGFGDPVLDELVVTALEENRQLAVAAARVDEFAARLGVTRAELFPQVGYDGIAARQRTSGLRTVPGASPVGELYQATLNVGWELDVWGRIRRATEAARANLLAAEEGRRSVILTLVTSVSTGYVALLGLDRQLEIAKRTLAGRAETVRLFEVRFAGGVVSELQLSQIRSEYEQAAAAVPRIQREIAVLENALSDLLGRPPGDIPRGRALESLTLPAVPAGVPSSLLARRPDVRQAEQNLIAANALIGVARARYFPSISLTGLFGYESVELDDLFEDGARFWSAGAAVGGPIFTAGAVSGQVEQAEAVRAQLVESYRQTVLTAFREVDDSLVTLRTAREELAAEERRVEALEKYLELATLRFDNGYSSYIEVLDAERSLFAAELAVVATRARVYSALIGVYKAMGGGWVETAEALAGDG